MSAGTNTGRVSKVLLASLWMGCIPAAHAEWTLGGGISRNSDPLISDVREARPFPVVTYRGERWTVMLGAARYKAWTSDWLEVSAIGNLRVSDIDDPFVRDGDDAASKAFDGIDRDLAVDLGVSFAFPTVVPAVIEWQHDVAGADAGGILTAMVPVPILERGPVSVGIALGGRWVTKEYVNYNYGVLPAEARRGRPAYASDRGSLIPYAGIEIAYAFGKRWSLECSLSYEHLGKEITRSPLVEDTAVLDADVSLLYRF